MAIINFTPTKFDYFDLGTAALEDGNVEKAISNFKKALDMDGHFTEVSIALADAYESIGEWDIANHVLFDALAKHPAQELVDEMYFKLAQNFLEMRKYDVVEYYVRDIAEKFDIQLPENFGEEGKDQFGGFKVVYPRGEDYYADLVQQGYKLVHERKFDEAIQLMDKVDKRSKSKAAADHLVLVCFMMKRDIDSVIDNAKKMLEYNPDNLSIRCTLATAYIIEDKPKEAYETVSNVLEGDLTSIEEIMIVLPILVNMEENVQIVKYTKRVLRTYRFQEHTMVWLSQALYNLGQVQEATKIMRNVQNIYGITSSADYFLQLYKQKPENVPFSMGMPVDQKVRYTGCLLTFFNMTDEEIAEAIEHDLCIDNAKGEPKGFEKLCIRQVLEWCVANEDLHVQSAIFEKLCTVRHIWVDNFVRKTLLIDDLSIDLQAVLVKCLAMRSLDRLQFDVVAQDRFKNVRFVFPRAMDLLPINFQSAIMFCVNDIVFTDEEQNIYLNRLTKLVNSIADVDDEGKLIYRIPHGEKVGRLRNIKTMAGVMLSAVYSDYLTSPRLDTIERYNLTPRTFDKYYKIFSGIDDDE